MKILSINKYYWKKGGSESVFFNEKEMLEAHGHQVIPFSMCSSNNYQTPYSKYFVDEVDYERSGVINRLSSALKIIYSVDARKKINVLLRDYQPDLAHFHIFQHQISPSVFGPLKNNNVPILLALHDLKVICPNYKMYVNGKVCEACKGGRFISCLKNKCTKDSVSASLINSIEMYFHYAKGYYQNVDRYIALSHFYRKKMIEYGFPADKVSYLPNYINVNDFNSNVNDKGYVLYFGRLEVEKGVSTLLDAAGMLVNVPFYIVGTGQSENVFKKKVVEKGLENVRFLGYKTGDELRDILAGATFVVVPSEWYENCPMSILEAFASGKPVIGSDIGGIPELIENEDDGLIFQPGDSQELADKMLKLWSNRGNAKEMGMVGRKKIEDRFNAELHYESLISIYNLVLN